MKKIALCSASILLAAGCTSLNVQPAEKLTNKEICIIENPSINPDFSHAYLRQISAKGYEPKLISKDAEKSCEITSTYTATYGFHWGTYLAKANLSIFKNGVLIGQANYDAPYASPAKHGRIEVKINAMVDQLVPNI